jgi:redox-sensitive bicupin YhaK (pirin superfamily)
MIIAERSRDIGSFLVGRLLPFRKKRMVGPFIFIDHMGPSKAGPGRWMDIGQHPHIGLSTLTYLFEGTIAHRDSIGTEQDITPGSVNWMTAGKGVVHTERTPQAIRDAATEQDVHGFQIWVALPKELEKMEPEFFHIPKDQLPVWEEKNIQFKLVAGEAFGRKSPVPVYSELFMLEVKTQDGASFDAAGALKGEIGICVVDGALEACGNRIEAGNMLVSKEADVCKISIPEKAHLLIFGGQPFAEERFIYWNFVASDKQTLEEAKERWKNKDFPMIEGDSSYIPLP